MDHEATTIELRDYRWHNRLLLLFAPDPQEPAYLEQRRLLDARQADMNERDLLLCELFADSGRLGRQALSERTIERIRNDFGVGNAEVTVLLIGKDGTVKRREASIVPPDDLFAQIDGMPMRRRELGGDPA